jgi:hypothetical protein
VNATESHVRAQCKRLSAAPMIEPRTIEGKREWIDALLRNCQSDEHVTTTMTAFLETVTNYQNPIAEICRVARAMQRPASIPSGCNRCAIGRDSAGEMCWAAHVPVERNGLSCAVRCDCQRGTWLARKDAERLNVPERKPPTKLEPVDFAKLAAGDLQ